MNCFRECLKLISDKPKEIAEELDLIESIALLGGFGVNMLPIQVRMCKDRLELVQKALDAKPFTYMNSQRVSLNARFSDSCVTNLEIKHLQKFSLENGDSLQLLKLGKQLQIQGANETEKQGKVLKLVAQCALKVGSFC